MAEIDAAFQALLPYGVLPKVWVSTFSWYNELGKNVTHLINIGNSLTGEELTKCVKKIKAELRYTTVDTQEEDIRKYASVDM